jgi:hypothetical protein
MLLSESPESQCCAFPEVVMLSSNLLLLNAEEVRRRSLMVWNSIPADGLSWKPDRKAMSCLEMVRHVLESEYLYTQMIRRRGSVSEESPFTSRPLTTVADEIAFASPFRKGLTSLIASIEPEELISVIIDRSDVGYKRKLGDFLLRVAYHEAVHCGHCWGTCTRWERNGHRCGISVVGPMRSKGCCVEGATGSRASF